MTSTEPIPFSPLPLSFVEIHEATDPSPSPEPNDAANVDPTRDYSLFSFNNWSTFIIIAIMAVLAALVINTYMKRRHQARNNHDFLPFAQEHNQFPPPASGPNSYPQQPPPNQPYDSHSYSQYYDTGYPNQAGRHATQRPVDYSQYQTEF